MGHPCRFYLLILLVISSVGWLSAQHHTLTGSVVDAVSGEAIAYANVTTGLSTQQPYRIENFAVSDLEGRFQLRFKQDSSYLLQVSYLGYETFIDTLNSTKLPEEFTVQLQPATNDLSTIEVKYKLPVRVSGDTISYSSDAFTDGNERKLEDVLKKLPGFKVDDNGQISVNGKKVEDLKIDGKDFFGGNSKLAARSLPADAVDRIDVLNNYQDDEHMGQFADGQSTALNIRLREDKKNLVFGEILGGSGPNSETDAGGNIFYFGPTTSVNLIGNHNDIGRQVLTYRDMFRFNGGFTKERGAGAISITPGQLGLGTDPELNAKRSSELAALSLQFQPSRQFNASGTLLYGNNRNQNLSRSVRTVLGQEATTSIEQTENRTSGNYSLTGLLRLDYQVNKALFISYRALAGDGMLGSEANTEIITPDQSIPELFQRNKEQSANLRQQLRFRYGKTERELWVWQLDQRSQRRIKEYAVESDNLSFSFTDSAFTRENTIRQVSDNDLSTYGARIDFYRSLNNVNQINLYTGVRLESSLFNARLTAAEEALIDNGIADNDHFRATTAFAGVGHRLKIRKWKFSPGLRLERSFWRETIAENTSGGSRSFLLPQVEIKYDIRKSSSISLAYNKSVSWPGADRRTSAMILRDFYTLATGTRLLRETTQDNLTLSYYNYNLFDQLTYSANITLSRMHRPLTQRILLAGTEQLITSVNAPQPGDLVSAYFQVSKYLEHFKLSGGMNNSLAVSRILVGETIQLNRSHSSTLKVNVRTRLKKWPNIALGSRINYSRYWAGEQDPRKYISLEPTAQVYGKLLPRLFFSSEYRYRNYRQIGANQRNVLDRLEASLRYETKNKLFSYEIKGFNLLNRAAFQREFLSDYLLSISEQAVLGRRLILSVTYQL